MGRPREFEPEEALEAIKDAFWRLGFDGASMNDIEAATGLKKQSLYREFGDKQAMYLAALNHYERNEVAEAIALLQKKGTARQRFERLFDMLIEERDHRGCFICNANVEPAPDDTKIRAHIAAMTERWLAAIDDALKASSPYVSNAKKRARKAAQLAAAYMGLRVLIKAQANETVLRDAAAETLAGI